MDILVNGSASFLIYKAGLEPSTILISRRWLLFTGYCMTSVAFQLLFFPFRVTLSTVHLDVSDNQRM